jgi:Zn-dependent M28 family amino/carboxypeptidase
MGLKGSEYFASHLPSDLGTCVGMINFDMVGEGDGMHAGYTPEPAPMKRALDEADAKAKTLKGASPIRGMGVQGSDHGPFMARGIPVISFSSNGPHLSYHGTGDTIYRVNPDMLGAAARLGFLAVVNVAGM